MKAVLATSNPGKAREMRAILGSSGIELETAPMWIGHEENGLTYLENARAKARAVMRYVHMPVLAEDAGIEVDALGGLPGVRSARFSWRGTDAANNAKLLALLDGKPSGARYRAVAILLFPDGTELVGEGVFEGRITHEPRGGNGFGYDPLFELEDGRTSAQLSPSEKDAISHRGEALRALVELVRGLA